MRENTQLKNTSSETFLGSDEGVNCHTIYSDQTLNGAIMTLWNATVTTQRRYPVFRNRVDHVDLQEGHVNHVEFFLFLFNKLLMMLLKCNVCFGVEVIALLRVSVMRPNKGNAFMGVSSCFRIIA